MRKSQRTSEDTRRQDRRSSGKGFAISTKSRLYKEQRATSALSPLRLPPVSSQNNSAIVNCYRSHIHIALQTRSSLQGKTPDSR